MIAQHPYEAVTLEAPHANWLSEIWRLFRWNLFLARRRVMSKVLLVLLLIGFGVVVGFQVLAYEVVLSAPISGNCATFTSTSPGGSSSSGSPNASANCPPPSVAELQQERAARDEAAAALSKGFTFPTSLSVAGGYIGFMGTLLLCILAGALTGSEYAFGTHRLVLPRGVSRAQVVIAQILALAALALGTSALVLVLSALIGVTLGPALGGTIPAIPGAGWGQLLLFWLVVAFTPFAYMVIAFFVATLGRSTAAGIGISLGYLFLEGIVSSILHAVGLGIGGDWGPRLEHIPDWFLGTNVSALVQHVSEGPLALAGTGGTAADIPGVPQALLVALAYCVVLIGVSYLLFRARDVTD